MHEFVAGDPYFVNGVVAEGRLFALDCWRCFSIDAGIRDILTSVVNEPATGRSSARCTRRSSASRWRAAWATGPCTSSSS